MTLPHHAGAGPHPLPRTEPPPCPSFLPARTTAYPASDGRRVTTVGGAGLPHPVCGETPDRTSPRPPPGPQSRPARPARYPCAPARHDLRTGHPRPRPERGPVLAAPDHRLLPRPWRGDAVVGRRRSERRDSDRRGEHQVEPRPTRARYHRHRDNPAVFAAERPAAVQDAGGARRGVRLESAVEDLPDSRRPAPRQPGHDLGGRRARRGTEVATAVADLGRGHGPCRACRVCEPPGGRNSALRPRGPRRDDGDPDRRTLAHPTGYPAVFCRRFPGRGLRGARHPGDLGRPPSGGGCRGDGCRHRGCFAFRTPHWLPGRRMRSRVSGPWPCPAP